MHGGHALAVLGHDVPLRCLLQAICTSCRCLWHAGLTCQQYEVSGWIFLVGEVGIVGKEGGIAAGTRAAAASTGWQFLGPQGRSLRWLEQPRSAVGRGMQKREQLRISQLSRALPHTPLHRRCLRMCGPRRMRRCWSWPTRRSEAGAPFSKFALLCWRGGAGVTLHLAAGVRPRRLSPLCHPPRHVVSTGPPPAPALPSPARAAGGGAPSAGPW